MKILWILLGLGVIVALVAAFFALNSYIYNEKQADENGENPAAGTTVELEGTVRSVNLTQVVLDGPALIDFTSPVGEVHTIAIPSMGLSLCAARGEIDLVNTVQAGDIVSVRGVLNEESQIVPCEDVGHYFHIGAGSYIDSELGYQFTYEKGRHGYVLTITDVESTDPAFRSGVQLMAYEDFTELELSTEPREGPPTIAVRVYENEDKRSANLWVDDNPQESNIELAIGEPEDAVIAGANAVRYTVDGLYPTQTYAVAHGGYMYVITGSYLDQESEMYREFQGFLASFVFLPIPTQLQLGEEIPQVQADGEATVDTDTTTPTSE